MSVEQDITKLCVSCGYCCDGTLFEKAKAYDSDTTTIEKLGLFPFGEGEKKFFRLPCHHFDGKCTVYDQTRPDTCGKFFCEPVRKVRKGENTVEEVQQLIDKVKVMRKQFRTVIQQQHPELQQLSLLEIRRRLLNVSGEEQKELRKKYPMLYLIGVKLFPLIRQFYRYKK